MTRRFNFDKWLSLVCVVANFATSATLFYRAVSWWYYLAGVFFACLSGYSAILYAELRDKERLLSKAMPWDAHRAETCLLNNGSSAPTYELMDGPSILCRCCGKRSWLADDVRELYCGFCHQFHLREWTANKGP